MVLLDNIKSRLWCGLTILLSLIEYGMSTCMYPDYMYGTAFPWMIRSSAGPSWQKRGYQEVDFFIDHARIKHTKSREPEHIVEFSTYQCITQVDNETVIVRIEEEGSDVPGNFTCIQFVKRTINVIQWKFGVSNAVLGPELCANDTLVLQAAPLVYYPHSSGFWSEERNADLKYEPCPASGGYIIRQWFNETGGHHCDFSKMIPLKLENECTTGEGIKLIEVGCRAPWNIPKEYFCLAHWEDENFLYMILWFTGINYLVPCFRLPLNRDNRFSGYFFLDGACDTGLETIEHSVSYARWLMEHHVSPGMCTDDTVLCHTKVLLNCTQVSHLCRESCGACPTENHFHRHWENILFSEAFQGTWVKDSFDLGKEEVIFNNNSLYIPSLGSFMNVGLSKCLKREPYRCNGLPLNTEEYSLLTFFENGCSPHGTSIVIGNWSSSVVSFRITKSKAIVRPLLTSWNAAFSKYTIKDSFGLLCENLGLYYYDTDPEPINTQFRVFPNGWFNMVRVSDPVESVRCYFPINFSRLKIRLHTGSVCNVRVEVPTEDEYVLLSAKTALEATSFNMVLEECDPGYDVEEQYSQGTAASNATDHLFSHASALPLVDEEIVEPLIEEVRAHKLDSHVCLASFRDRLHNRYIITLVTSEEPLVQQKYLCWLFSGITGRAYWLPISSCDSNIERQLGRVDYEPYAVIDSAPALWYTRELQFGIVLLSIFHELGLL